MAKGKNGISASSKAVDPTLDALFASSSGPVTAPAASRYSDLLPIKEKKSANKASTQDVSSSQDEAEEDDEVLSELSGQDLEDEDAESESSEEEEPAPRKKDRKRKRKDDHDDLEAKYLSKLADDEDDEAEQEESADTKRRKGEDGQAVAAEESDDDTPMVHESLLREAGEDKDADIEMDKANRTLFLGNVSMEAMSSKRAKQQLLAHLEAPLASLDAATGPHTVESLRFRSTPYSTGAMPKRAAFITKQLMPSTASSTNAYAVFSTAAASRAAHTALNATVILDRHLRVDSVAHPTPIAHRRCVFVGNLGFVDDETVINTTAEGETTTKKRFKTPSDIEEGLWRVFGGYNENKNAPCKVESVRVPRDPKTRVGKGFAYVQFKDANDVEHALLLNEKKFPPMLPRALRVSRAKDPRKTQLAMERSTAAKLEAADDKKSKSTKYKVKATPEQQSLAGRASRLLGKSGAVRQRNDMKKGKFAARNSRGPPRHAAAATGGGDGGETTKVIKTPEQIVFEGRRASAKDGKPKDLKFGKKGGGGKKRPQPRNQGRGARRAAEWRKKDA